MKAKGISIGLLGILLLASCRSSFRVGESFTFVPYTICTPEEAKLSLHIKCAFAGLEVRACTLYFPSEFSKYKLPSSVPADYPLELCVCSKGFASFDPPDPQFWTYGFERASLTGVVVSVSCTKPGTRNRLIRELKIPWFVESGSTNGDFWYRATWERKEPNNRL